MRAPKNIVKLNYTTGEKYLDSNFNPYVGYYCEVKGKAYPGKVYTGRSKQLVLASSLVKDNTINSYNFFTNLNDSQGEHVLRYFTKSINTIPIIIKEIDFSTYNKIKSNPLHQTIVLKYTVFKNEGRTFRGLFDDKEIEQAEKQMPGIKLYLQEELL